MRWVRLRDDCSAVAECDFVCFSCRGLDCDEIVARGGMRFCLLFMPWDLIMMNLVTVAGCDFVCFSCHGFDGDMVEADAAQQARLVFGTSACSLVLDIGNRGMAIGARSSNYSSSPCP